MKGTVHKKFRSILVSFLIICIALACMRGDALKPDADIVYADTPEDIRDEAKEDLDDVNDLIKDINQLQEKIAEDIEGAIADMEKLANAQNQLADSILAKNEEIDATTKELLAANKAKEKAYEDMKLRIKYMYENSSDEDVLAIFLESQSIAEVLSRLEYFDSVHESDRRLMIEYEIIIEETENIQMQLMSDLDQLLDMQVDYSTRQDALVMYIDELSKESTDYASQLDNAKKQVAEYEAIIAEQERIIREQEALAAKLAAEQAAKYEGGGAGEAGFGSAAYLTDPSYDPPFTSDITGEELVNYALRFVGNPYKWGGNSLTKGCDCSGFVNLIYKHFGFDVPRYSQSFRTFGEPVAYENIKAGDIVVYPGHVAIYMGNGYIVEAQSTKRGITCNRILECHTILAIRRVL
ncbi:MAG: C40 family peptidase [Lachnospiraceae bacterium]|nr:C40 family peptidase [Lachnospiraceae bacterium]